MKEQEQISAEGMIRRLRHIPWTIECGLHSGIPPCCVRFYAMRWMFSVEGDAFRRVHQKLMNRWGRANLGYISCPTCCKTGLRAVVLPCPDDTIPCYHADEQAK